MAAVNSYDVYVLNVSGHGSKMVYSTDGSAAIASSASLVDDNNTTGSSTSILGDTPYDSFEVAGYTSASTVNGSDVLTDAGGSVPLVYRGYLTSVVGGVTYHAAVGEDLDTGNYFLFAPTGTPVAAMENNTFGFIKDVITAPGTQWGIRSEAPYCFLAGTMLHTPSGEAAVEDIQAGDLVLTAAGVAKPVRWIGRTVVAAKFADKLCMFPVRIKTGALADNVPSRDLLVSPGHAIMVEGVLVHAGAMVNGTSIVREAQMPLLFTYFHVELDAHDLLVAENTPAESFLEAIADMRLDNFPERATLPGEAAVTEMPFARVKAARQLPESVRTVIDARAGLVTPELSFAA